MPLRPSSPHPCFFIFAFSLVTFPPAPLLLRSPLSQLSVMINIHFHLQHMPSVFACWHTQSQTHALRHNSVRPNSCTQSTLMNNSFSTDLGGLSLARETGKRGENVCMCVELIVVIGCCCCLCVCVFCVLAGVIALSLSLCRSVFERVRLCSNMLHS